MIAALSLAAALVVQTRSVTGQQTPPDRYLVVMVMDGFRPDYMKLAPMPNLHGLMRSGMVYQRAWVGQLETETPTGHATIVTGVYPSKHSVIGFGWRAPDGGYTWMPTDLRLLNAGDMESLIEASGVPTLSDAMHRAYPGSRAVSLSGEKYYAADAMGTGADYILYEHGMQQGMQVSTIGKHVPPPSTHYQRFSSKQNAYPWVQDTLVASMATHLLQSVRPRTMLINLPGTDIEGHVTGGIINRRAMRHEADYADRAIGSVVNAYKRAGLYKKTLFVVTADHGMLPNSHIVPIKKMYASIRSANAPALEDDLLSTGGYIYLRNPVDAPKVASTMVARHFPGVDGALYRTDPRGPFQAEARTAKVLGPALTQAYLDLANTIASQAGPDIITPYAEDTMGLTVKGSGKQWGNHGGLSWRVQHIPLVLSGPGVVHGTSWFPAKLADIAPTIERVLGLPVPAGVDGVVLANAIQGATASDKAPQLNVAGRRSADVRALMQHSRAQHAIALGM